MAYLLPFLFGFMPQDMATSSPVRSDGLSNRNVIFGRMGVNIPGVGKLTTGGAIDLVNLLVSKLLQGGHAQFLGQGVNASMLEELLPSGVCLGCKFLGSGRSLGLCHSVVMSVLELQETSECFDIFFREGDTSLMI